MFNSSFNIDDYEEETQAILTEPPNWVLRNGMTIISVAFASILVVCHFVEYPDVINSEITITSFNTPAEITAKVSGRLNLFVEENELVKPGAKLGYISNASNYYHIQTLSEFLSKIQRSLEDNDVVRIQPPKNLITGELEGSYGRFLNSLNEYVIQININSYPRRLQDLTEQGKIVSAMGEQLSIQKTTIIEELQLAKNRLHIDSVLFRQSVITDMDLKKSVSTYLPYKKQLEQIEYSIVTNNLKRTELSMQINYLTIQYLEAKDRLKINLMLSYRGLLNEIRIWEERNVLTAPIEGKVSFFQFWNNNQNVELGKTVLTVMPQTNNMFGYLLMPFNNAGKAKIGQTVNIKLYGYPFNEFGLIKGEIFKISAIPENNTYAVTVKLPMGLRTTHDKLLELKEQMKGSSEIVTEKKSLFKRFFYQINKIFKQ